MPTYQITAPNGRTYRIDGPPGASDKQVRAAVLRQYPDADKPSFGKQVMNVMGDNVATIAENLFALPDMAATGLGKGAAAVASALGADKVAAALQNPFTVGGAVRKALPEVPGNEIGRAVGGAGTAFIGGAGVAGALARGGKVAQGVAKSLLEAPRAQVIGGTAGNLAIAGAKAAGASPGVQVAAGLLAGGVAPGSLDAAATTVRGAVDPLVPSYVRQQAARILKDNVLRSPEDVARRIDMATARPAMSGAAPTTAEVAGDAGLAGFQRTLQANPKAGGQISERMASNAQRRMTASDRAMGPGDTTRLAAEADAVAARNARLMAAGRDRVGPYEPADVTGEAARGALSEAGKAAKARASRLYEIPGGNDLVQIGALDPGVSPPPPGDGAVGRFARNVRDTLAERIPEADAAGMRAQGGTLAGMLKGQVHPDSPLGRDLTRLGYGPQQRPDLYNRMANPRMELDKVITSARERGFLPAAPIDAPDTYGANDFIDALVSDLAATGRGGAGSRAMTAEGRLSQAEAQARQQNQDYVSQMLDERGLDPSRMAADDWDALYRDVNGLPERPVTQADMEFLSDGANAAQGVATLSPFQASLVDLQRQFFPAGLPAKSGVSALIRQLTNADVMETRQVERIVRDLRAQAGLLRMSDGASAALAKAAANAAEGFLSSQAGPARMAAMQRARAGWRDYSSTFREGEPGRALATNQFGTPALDAGRVPAALVPAGRTGATAAARLQKAVGPEQAESIARTELRRALEAAGNDAGNVAAVADRYADTLRAYPDAARDVAAAKEIAALSDAFTRSPLAKVGAAGDPVQAVGQFVRAQDGGRALRQLVGQVQGNPEAAAGLRRALAGHIEAASTARGGVGADGAALVNNNGLRMVLSDVLDKTAMTKLLTREQRKVLLNVRMETKRAQFAMTANRTPGSDTARNAETWARFASVVAQGVGGAKVGAAKTVLDLAVSVLGRADAVRQLTVEAMLDPKLAAELLRTPTPERVKSLAARMAGYARGAQLAAYSADKM